MAPRKSAATANPAKKNSTTSESNKVVERPARGYRKYKNGLLDVTPQRDEENLVRKNQDSPLLRLPPEIRNRIWEYTLEHSIFRAIPNFGSSEPAKFESPPEEPAIGVTLFRTCRQIYSEAASMPFKLNAFAFNEFWAIKKAMTPLKTYQRKFIRSV
ncbi:hypothetical protein E8E12_011066 [Didymella heteroderae]|uniref:2EXR domain-containing protein n=1 Tax=Didymella heteroderae TaxID=1769908 RepID=A0A9P4WYK3_9PLEO|nr:hypothetical protein E8E12_011066 [Didymella heteroderae]